MVESWRDTLIETYAVSTVHTYIAGVCCGLGISMDDIARYGTTKEPPHYTCCNAGVFLCRFDFLHTLQFSLVFIVCIPGQACNDHNLCIGVVAVKVLAEAPDHAEGTEFPAFMS